MRSFVWIKKNWRHLTQSTLNWLQQKIKTASSSKSNGLFTNKTSIFHWIAINFYSPTGNLILTFMLSLLCYQWFMPAWKALVHHCSLFAWVFWIPFQFCLKELCRCCSFLWRYLQQLGIVPVSESGKSKLSYPLLCQRVIYCPLPICAYLLTFWWYQKDSCWPLIYLLFQSKLFFHFFKEILFRCVFRTPLTWLSHGTSKLHIYLFLRTNSISLSCLRNNMSTASVCRSTEHAPKLF